MPAFRFQDAFEPGAGSRALARGAAIARFGAPEEPPLTFGGRVGDVLAAPFRGVEGAVQGAYNLVDTIAFDALPDYDERFLGRSRTMIGGVVEGLSNFAAGFVPVAGWLGRAGRVGQVLDVTVRAQQAARTARAAALIGVGRAAAAGAITDFAFFDAHEARLSNLLVEYPTLRNPITEYLASSPEDGQVEGRLKNALEGLFVGSLVDAVGLGLKAYRAGARARAAGESAQSVARAVRDAVNPAEIQGALDSANRTPIDPAFPRERGEPVPKVDPDVPSEPTRILETLLIDQDAARALAQDVEDAKALGIDPGGNPRRVDPLELAERGLTERDLNLERFQVPDGEKALIRAFERYGQSFFDFEMPGRTSETMQEITSKNVSRIVDILNAADSREAVVAAIQRDAETLTDVAGRAQGWVFLLASLERTVARSLDDALAAPAEVAPARWARALQKLEFKGDVLGPILGMQSETGRLLKSYDIPIESLERELSESAPHLYKEVVDGQIEEILAKYGGIENVKRQAAKLRALQGDGGIRGQTALVAFVRNALDPVSGMRMFNEFWLNSLLSGPRTLTTAGMAPLFTSVIRPLERVVGGGIQLARGQSGEAVSSGIRQALGLFRDADEAFRAAKEATRLRRNIIDPTGTVVDLDRSLRPREAAAIRRAQAEGRRTPGAFDPDVLGADAESFGGQVLRLFDRVVGTPSSLLGGIDEFVKQLNIRSLARDNLHREAVELGFSGPAITDHVEARMGKLIHDGQLYSRARLVREGASLARERGLQGQEAVRYMLDYVGSQWDERLSSIAEEGLARGLEVTATAPLESGTLGKSISDAVNKHPFLRIVLPFVRTPTNLLIQARQRADVYGPVRLLVGKRFDRMPSIESTRNRFIRDMVTGDQFTQADAMGRVATGISAVTFFVGMAASGRITGRGPDERNRAAALRQAGWQPYSVRIGDRWVSYERLDPWAALIGFAADYVEYAQWADTAEQSTIETVGAALVTATANQLTQKSYLTGLRNAIEALSEPERRAQSYLEQLVGNLTVPSFLAAGVELAGDQHMREVRGVLDAARNRIPGISGTLEPRRNVLGEPIERTRRLGADEVGEIQQVWMPVSYSEVSDDFVDTQLALLQHGFGAPSTTRGGVDLLEFRSEAGQTAFDRWQELHGEVRVGGRSLRESLTRLFRSRTYQRTPAESMPELDSPRIGMVENVIREYRDRAFQQVLREYPELRIQYRQLGLLRRRRAIGAPTPTVQVGIGGFSARLPALVSPSESRSREVF